MRTKLNSFEYSELCFPPYFLSSRTSNTDASGTFSKERKVFYPDVNTCSRALILSDHLSEKFLTPWVILLNRRLAFLGTFYRDPSRPQLCCHVLFKAKIHKIAFLTLLVPRVLVPTPSTKEGGGVKWTLSYLKNDKCYKSETLGAVRGILQGYKKFIVDITTFVC